MGHREGEVLTGNQEAPTPEEETRSVPVSFNSVVLPRYFIGGCHGTLSNYPSQRGGTLVTEALTGLCLPTARDHSVEAQMKP